MMPFFYVLLRKRTLITTLLLCPLAVAAQQNQSLDEVVITAGKFYQKTSETGKVITTISAKEIAHSAGKNLSELLNEQPGITVNGAGQSPGSVETVYMRGSDPQYTLILLDGVPVSDVSYNVDRFDLNLIPVASIDHIEIIRGGYGSLYGSGAAAGVINIITKKGGEKPFNVQAALSAGSYGTFQEQAGLSGEKGKIDYHISFQHMDSRGFSSAEDSTGRGHFDKDGFHRDFVMAAIGYHPTAHWTFRPYARFSAERGGLDYGAFSDDKDYTYHSRFFQAGVAVDHQFDGGDLHFKYSYQPTVRHYLNDSLDGSSYLKQPFSSYMHTADLYANFQVSPRISVLAGSTLDMEKTTQSTLSVYGGYPSFSKLSGDSANANALNVYGALYFHTQSGFHLELSGRLNQHKLYGLHPVFSVNPSWLLGGKTKLFANVSSSYTAPSLYQLYSVYGNRSLKPETGLNLEGGVETFLAHKRLRLQATGFAGNQRRVIAFQVLDPITYASQYVNYNHQRLWGGELEGDFRISERLRAKAYYAYVSGKVTARSDATGKDSTYQNLFKKPAHSAGASLGFQALPALYLSLNAQYKGQRKDLTYDALSHQVVKALHGYALLNFYAEYTLKTHLKIYAQLNNITNTRYTEITGYTEKRFNFDAGAQWTLF